MQPDTTPTSEDVISSLSPPPYPFWGWIDFALVMGLMVALFGLIIIAAAVIAAVVPSLRTNMVPLLLPAQLAMYVAIYLPIFIVFRVRHGKPVFSSLGWKKPNEKSTLLWVGLSGMVLSIAVDLILVKLHSPEVEMDVLAQLQDHPILLALLGLIAITLAPLFEELLFRGFMQPLFSRTLGVAAGIFLTAVLFGLLHSIQYKYVWQYVAGVTFVGIVLGIVRYRTGSIMTTTIMHACYNSVAALGLLVHHK